MNRTCLPSASVYSKVSSGGPNGLGRCGFFPLAFGDGAGSVGARVFGAVPLMGLRSGNAARSTSRNPAARSASGRSSMHQRHPTKARPSFSDTWNRSSPPQTGQGPDHSRLPTFSSRAASAHSWALGNGSPLMARGLAGFF